MRTWIGGNHDTTLSAWVLDGGSDCLAGEEGGGGGDEGGFEKH